MIRTIMAAAGAVAILGFVAPAAADWEDACSCSVFGGNGPFGSSPPSPSGVSASVSAKHGAQGHANAFPGLARREKQQWGRPFEGPIGPNQGGERWHQDNWNRMQQGRGGAGGGGSSHGIDSHGSNVGNRQPGWN